MHRADIVVQPFAPGQIRSGHGEIRELEDHTDDGIEAFVRRQGTTRGMTTSWDDGPAPPYAPPSMPPGVERSEVPVYPKKGVPGVPERGSPVVTGAIEPEPCRVHEPVVAAAREGQDALFSPSGALQHAEGRVRDDRDARRVLTDALRDVERARSSRTRSDPSKALELWRGLVAGEWSLVDAWESDGRRHVAAYRNRPEVTDPRHLTPLERVVLRYASLCCSNKEIAFTLGLSESSIATAVGPTERAVALAVATGKTNREIGRDRGTSERTIANHVRRIFEKLGVRSRVELARALTQG